MRASAVKSADCRVNPRQRYTRRRRGTGGSSFVVTIAVVLAVLAPIARCTVTGSFKALESSDAAFVAGSELQMWWGQRGDVDLAVEQLGGVQQCPEDVNSRLDSELLSSEDALLASCRQDAADFDLTTLFQAAVQMEVPTKEQTTRMCLSEACAAWFAQAVEATWLPECRYRQSQTSFRSLAETLLRIREDLTLTSAQVAVVAPNASAFRQLYQINQLVNLLNEKEAVDEVEAPDMQVARQLSTQTDFESVDSGEATELSNAVAASTSGSSITPSGTSNAGSSSSLGSTSSSSGPSSSSAVSSTSSSGSSNSVGGDWLTSDSFNGTDNAGFNGSGLGPHAKSTATTTELGTSYAFLVGAWVLFNGSYFFLMRKK